MRLIERLSVAQRIAASGAILLVVFMLLPWFGTKDEKTPNGIVLPARHVTVDAWNPFDFSLGHPLRGQWLIALVLTLSIAAVLFSVLRVNLTTASRQLRETASIVAAGAGLLATILVLYRVLVPIHLVVRWYGLFLSLLAALAMAYGGLRWMDDEKAAVRGVTVADATRRLRALWRQVQQARQR
jgi:hypothetical protein